MVNQTILLIDDEKDLTSLVSLNLKEAGFDCLVAQTAAAGLETVRERRPVLLISDLALSGMGGLEMLRILRRESSLPVLLLTARNAEADRVAGLRLGADDCLAKPFSMRELVCRVKAILRRVKPPRRLPQGVLRAGGIEIDRDRHQVLVNGVHRRMTSLELELLTLLIEADGKVLSRHQLLKRIWGYAEDLNVSTRTVDQHIARLRRNLLSEKRRIVTVGGLGYRFAGTDV